MLHTDSGPNNIMEYGHSASLMPNNSTPCIYNALIRRLVNSTGLSFDRGHIRHDVMIQAILGVTYQKLLRDDPIQLQVKTISCFTIKI